MTLEDEVLILEGDRLAAPPGRLVEGCDQHVASQFACYRYRRDKRWAMGAVGVTYEPRTVTSLLERRGQEHLEARHCSPNVGRRLLDVFGTEVASADALVLRHVDQLFRRLVEEPQS